LHKTFGKKKVLDGVDLRIEAGETMVIIGRSGCGKSVLLKHLVGLFPPDRGSVAVDGTELRGIRKRELYALRRRFGMLFQGAALFDSMTVAENVGLGLRQHSDLPPEEVLEVVRRKLSMVGMAGTEQLMPAELSGGMKKRVGLARALAMDPSYVLYDEPTTGLDPIMADKINDLIVDLQKKLSLTSVVVTHDMVSANKVGDRIAMMHQGRIIFCGTPRQIAASADERVQQFIRGEAD
ncbi:ABC transporter ATP-binding protein, partial [bacterium]|nr:ABC transporter ATP-binding protein [bacterium]